MTDLVTWLRAVMTGLEADAKAFLELQPELPDWPQLALAEVAAKRRLLDLHQHQRFAEPTDSRPNAHPDDRRKAFAEDPKYVGCRRCHFDYRDEEVHPYFWCETVRLLARPYADHPGYRDDWRPDEA